MTIDISEGQWKRFKIFQCALKFYSLKKKPKIYKEWHDLCIDCVDGINNDRSLMLSHTSQMLCSYRMLYIRQAVIDAK